MYRFHFTQEDDLVTFAQALIPLLRKGDILALQGTLGAGKTALARQIIQKFPTKEGTPLPETVPSPTFTLLQYYDRAIPLWHFDLYRLQSPEEAYELDIEDAFLDIALIEWPDRLGSLLPSRHLCCHLSIPENEGERYLDLSSQDPTWQDRLMPLAKKMTAYRITRS